MYCLLALVAVAGLAARQALALRAPVVAVVAVVASGCLCSLAQRFLLHTPRVSFLSASALVAQQGRA